MKILGGAFDKMPGRGWEPERREWVLLAVMNDGAHLCFGEMCRVERVPMRETR
ncbi:MAG: hypothetical protein OXC68_09120 [Aestuariivita sp.]|nr:hypothetical protein [Aestuariivita sp.]